MKKSKRKRISMSLYEDKPIDREILERLDELSKRYGGNHSETLKEICRSYFGIGFPPLQAPSEARFTPPPTQTIKEVETPPREAPRAESGGVTKTVKPEPVSEPISEAPKPEPKPEVKIEKLEAQPKKKKRIRPNMGGFKA